jgi:hypothetical protein
MLTSQRKTIAMPRETMMFQTKIVIRVCLARATIWVLAVSAWVTMSVTALGNARDEVRTHMRDANIVFQALSGCGEPAYRSCRSRRFGNFGLRMSESELTGKPSISFQRRSVAFTA